MTTQTQSSKPLISLPTIRRLYFYLVAFVSLIAGMAAIDGLVATLNELWPAGEALYTVGTGAVWRNSVARNGGLLLVATPIFLVHWGYAQRRLTSVAERRAALRKLFLYGASGVGLGYALARGYELLSGVAFIAFGGNPNESQIWPSQWLYMALMTLLGLGLIVYLRSILLADGDYGHETTRAGTVRRLYQAIVGVVGLLALIFGSARMLGALWQLLIDSMGLTVMGDWWPITFSDGLAAALLGALVAHTNWRRWQAIVDNNPAEATAALRRLYLYAAVVISALAVLVPAANLLHEFLLILLGSGTSSLALLLDRVGVPLSFIPAGLIGWVWHWRYLKHEAARAGESEEGAVIRRVYYYAVAATGLVLLWLGTVDILSAGLDALLTSDALKSTEPIWVESLATGLSLLAVGAPVWAMHWRTVQRIARRPDQVGQAERDSAPRKIYLYGVALVGALLILFDFSQVLYRLLLVLLGEPNMDIFSAQTASEIARGLVSAVLWLVHVMAIQQDSRLTQAMPAPEKSSYTESHSGDAEEHRSFSADTALGDGTDEGTTLTTDARRKQLLAKIDHLEGELLAAKAELTNLNPAQE